MYCTYLTYLLRFTPLALRAATKFLHSGLSRAFLSMSPPGIVWGFQFSFHRPSPSCLWPSPLPFSFRCPMDCCFWNSSPFHSKHIAYPARTLSSNDRSHVLLVHWASRSLLEITHGHKTRRIFLRDFV